MEHLQYISKILLLDINILYNCNESIEHKIVSWCSEYRNNLNKNQNYITIYSVMNEQVNKSSYVTNYSNCIQEYSIDTIRSLHIKNREDSENESSFTILYYKYMTVNDIVKIFSPNNIRNTYFLQSLKRYKTILFISISDIESYRYLIQSDLMNNHYISVLSNNSIKALECPTNTLHYLYSKSVLQLSLSFEILFFHKIYKYQQNSSKIDTFFLGQYIKCKTYYNNKSYISTYINKFHSNVIIDKTIDINPFYFYLISNGILQQYISSFLLTNKNSYIEHVYTYLISVYNKNIITPIYNICVDVVQTLIQQRILKYFDLYLLDIIVKPYLFEN